MGQNTAPQRPVVPTGVTRHIRVSFKGQLDAGVLLTGTPTVAEVTTTDLTITNKAVNSSTLTINQDAAVLAGQAVQFTVAGAVTTNSPYTIKITVSTDDSQTLVAYSKLLVANE